MVVNLFIAIVINNLEAAKQEERNDQDAALTLEAQLHEVKAVLGRIEQTLHGNVAPRS